MTDVHKSRVLGRDPGITGVFNVDPLSGLSYQLDMLRSLDQQRFFDKRILDKHHEHLASANTNFVFSPVYLGMELFNSTKRLRPAFNDCWHQKNKLVCYPFTYMFPGVKNSYGQLIYWANLRRLAFPSGSAPRALGLSSFDQYDGAARRAWWAMQPRFEGEVSMLNFLFELKDFKDIAKHLLSLKSPTEIVGKMRSFRSRLRAIDSRLYSKDHPISIVNKIVDTGTSSAKITAQTHLIKEFALKPLISDLASIMKQAGEIVREVQAEYLEKGQTEQVRHYSEWQVLYDTLVNGDRYNLYWSKGTYEEEIFTSTLSYKYDYKMRSQSDAFLTYWGLKLTPEVIWNGTPFSFLFDYFAKFGRMCHDMKVDPNVKVLPTQYCESILRSYSSGYVASGDPLTNLALNGKYPIKRGTCITGYTGSTFARVVKPPNKGLAVPSLKLPSGRQGANMAALAVCFIK